MYLFLFFRNNLQKSEKEILCARGRELFQLLEKCLWCTLTQKQHICLRSELENKVQLEIFFVKAEMVLEFMVRKNKQVNLQCKSIVKVLFWGCQSPL